MKKFLFLSAGFLCSFASAEHLILSGVTLRHIKAATGKVEVTVGNQTVENDVKVGKVDGFLPVAMEKPFFTFVSKAEMKKFVKKKFCDVKFYNRHELTDNRFFGIRIRDYQADEISFISLTYKKDGKTNYTSTRCH